MKFVQMCEKIRGVRGVLFTRADTFGDSGAAHGTSDQDSKCSTNSPTGPNSFSFKDLTGDPGLLSLELGPFKALPAD